MPYIPQQHRPKLDPHIDELAEAIKKVALELGDEKTSFAGLWNYACTKLALKVIPERRYWVMALMDGTMDTMRLEFYRRYVAPYEDEQVTKNGDVY